MQLTQHALLQDYHTFHKKNSCSCFFYDRSFGIRNMVENFYKQVQVRRLLGRKWLQSQNECVCSNGGGNFFQSDTSGISNMGKQLHNFSLYRILKVWWAYVAFNILLHSKGRKCMKPFVPRRCINEYKLGANFCQYTMCRRRCPKIRNWESPLGNVSLFFTIVMFNHSSSPPLSSPMRKYDTTRSAKRSTYARDTQLRYSKAKYSVVRQIIYMYMYILKHIPNPHTVKNENTSLTLCHQSN